MYIYILIKVVDLLYFLESFKNSKSLHLLYKVFVDLDLS